MYLLQSTYEAIQRETKLTKKLVILDFCNANRHRSVAKGTIMSCMLVAKGIEHGLLHLNGVNNWRFMRCGGSCSHCRDVDPGRATNIAKRAFERFLPSADESRHVGQRLPAKEAIVGVGSTPEALRPGRGLPQPLGDLLQLSQVQSVGPLVGLRQPALLTAFPFWDLVVLLRPPIRYPRL